MKPVAQACTGRGPKFGEPYGDCLRASLASILELPLEAVPHFVADSHHEDWRYVVGDWCAQMNAWLRLHYGLMVLYWKAPDNGWTPPGYHLLDGISPRGVHHSTVGLDGRTVHDPHPAGGGIVGEIEYGVFVSLDPSRAASNTTSKAEPRDHADVDEQRAAFKHQYGYFPGEKAGDG